jgi:hypothetical protein
MKYNRLMLFRPWLFHNAGPEFGDSIENGSIIYLMFIATSNTGRLST